MLGSTELLVLGILVVTLFGGAAQIPKLARSLGAAKREFQDAAKNIDKDGPTQ